MAEAVGALASGLTIVEGVAHVIRTVLSCKAATKESRRLVRELSYIRSLLDSLKFTAQEQETSNDAWDNTVFSLNDNGVLSQFQQLLDLLDQRIRHPSQSSGLKKLKSVLEWPFREPEALKLLDAVERYKSLFELALDNNHIRLSKATRDELKDLSILVQAASRVGKDVLEAVKQNNEKLAVVQSDIQETKELWQKTSLDIDKLSKMTKDAEFENIFKRLTTWNFWDRQRDILSQRVGATGQWFLSTATFEKWKSDAGQWLICNGAPGVGKSVLASIITAHLQATCPNSTCILAFYFDHAYSSNKRYEDFLGSLLQQMLYSQPSTWDAVKDACAQHQHGPKLQPSDLLALLRTEIQKHQTTYLVLDALDEWSNDASEISKVVSDLEGLGSNINILVMSRPLPQFEQVFQDKTQTEIQPPDTDLEDYIRSRLVKAQRERRFIARDVELQESIVGTVMENCECLFLLARLQMDQLTRRVTKRALQHNLNQLPRTPETLYDNIMARIEAQSAEEANLAKRTFAWVLHAREPPQVQLIQYTHAFEEDDSIIDEDRIVDWEVLSSLCGGLIVCEGETATVRFVHPTTRSYFQTYFDRQRCRSESLLTSACLTFFLSSTFQDVVAHSGRPSRQGWNSGGRAACLSQDRPHVSAFLRYAATYFISHYRSTADDGTCTSSLINLFQRDVAMDNFWLVHCWYNRDSYGWRLSTLQHTDRMCIAGFLGLERIVTWLLHFGLSPNDVDTTGQRPLYAAASRNESEVVQILLDNGARPDLRSFDALATYPHDSNAIGLCFTAMHCALRRGNVPLAKLLVDHGASTSSNPRDKWTNLTLAIQSRAPEMVKFVLQQDSYVFRVNSFWEGDVVSYAITNGAVEVVKTLLEAGAPIMTTLDKRCLVLFGNAIQAAPWRVSDNECSTICNVMLDHMTPAQQAFVQSNLFRQHRPSKLLLYDRTQTLTSLKLRFWTNEHNSPTSAFGALWQCLCGSSPADAPLLAQNPKLRQVTAEDFIKSNVLLLAVFRGWLNAVQPLLQLAEGLDCDPSAKTAALCEAVELNQSALVSLILRFNPPINMSLTTGTPLCTAVFSQDVDMVSSLLNACADPDAPCTIFGSAMHAVCSNEGAPWSYVEMVIGMLVDHGADVNKSYGEYGTILTALARTSSVRSLDLMRQLLTQGADCNVTGGTHHTPMIAAAASSGDSSLDVMQLLHDAGAELDAFGGAHGTALLAAAASVSHFSSDKLLKLFQWGADATITGPKGTLVELGIKHPNARVRNLILEQRSDVGSKLWCEALVEAAASGGIETMIQLIENGTDVNGEADFLGTAATPIVAALASNTEDTLQKVDLLVANGASLNVEARGYSSPLQMCLDYKFPDRAVVELLLSNGSDPNAPSGPFSLGTPTEIAVRHYREDDTMRRGIWKEIIIQLNKREAAFVDDDFDFLLQEPWFLEAITGEAMEVDDSGSSIR